MFLPRTAQILHRNDGQNLPTRGGGDIEVGFLPQPKTDLTP